MWVALALIFHESSTATADMAALPGVLRVPDLATYYSSTVQVQLPAVSRWHGHIHGLATTIHINGDVYDFMLFFFTKFLRYARSQYIHVIRQERPDETVGFRLGNNVSGTG